MRRVFLRIEKYYVAQAGKRDSQDKNIMPPLQHRLWRNKRNKLVSATLTQYLPHRIINTILLPEIISWFHWNCVL